MIRVTSGSARLGLGGGGGGDDAWRGPEGGSRGRPHTPRRPASPLPPGPPRVPPTAPSVLGVGAPHSHPRTPTRTPRAAPRAAGGWDGGVERPPGVVRVRRRTADAEGEQRTTNRPKTPHSSPPMTSHTRPPPPSVHSPALRGGGVGSDAPHIRRGDPRKPGKKKRGSYKPALLQRISRRK